MNISIAFDEYTSILLNKQTARYKMRKNQSKKHKIGTYKTNKISLSCFKDKIFVLDDGVHTLDIFIKT